MNQKHLLFVGAVLATAVSAPLFLGSAQPLPVHGGNEKIEHPMEDLNGSLKRLEKALAAKDTAAALPLIIKMQSACQEAKVEAPAKSAEISDAAKKAEFLNGYRKTMIGLQKDLLDIEALLIDGKADEAAKIVAEKVKPSKKSGHDAYKGE